MTKNQPQELSDNPGCGQSNRRKQPVFQIRLYKNMDINDYLKYSASIRKGDRFFIISIDGNGWEGALSQGRDMEEARMMAKEAIYDYIEGLVEFKKRVPVPTVIDDGSRSIIDVGYDTALKIMLRNTMIDMMVRPAELARRLKVSNQRLNSILSFRKTTGLNALADCFNALGKPLSITLWDQRQINSNLSEITKKEYF